MCGRRHGEVKFVRWRTFVAYALRRRLLPRPTPLPAPAGILPLSSVSSIMQLLPRCYCRSCCCCCWRRRRCRCPALIAVNLADDRRGSTIDVTGTSSNCHCWCHVGRSVRCRSQDRGKVGQLLRDDWRLRLWLDQLQRAWIMHTWQIA